MFPTVSVHLAMRFQRRLFFLEIDQSETIIENSINSLRGQEVLIHVPQKLSSRTNVK